MRLVLFLFSVSFLTCLKAQSDFGDTVRIPMISVEESKNIIPTTQKLDSAALNQSIQKDLGEVLAVRSNLFVKSYGMGSQATVSLRGSGSSHTNVFWNGIGLNSSMNGVVDLSLYPALFLDEAEVKYGNSSLKSGSGGFGGAIHLENKVQFRKQKNLTLNQQFGSFNFRNSEIKYETGNNRFQSVSRFFYRTTNNNFKYKDLGEEGSPIVEVENAFLEQKSLMQSFYYRLNEKRRLEFHFWYYDSDRNLPPLMTLNNFNENQKDESFRGLIGYKNYLEKGFFAVKSSILKDEIDYFNERLAKSSISQNLTFKNIAEVEKKWERTNFYSRLNVDLEQAEHQSFSSTIQRERISIFGSLNQQLIPKLKIELSARQEWIITETSFFLPSLMLTYNYNQKLVIFSKASKNIRYPSLNDLYWEFGGNENLKAEENQSIEVGFSFSDNLIEEKYSWEVKSTTYYSDIKNYIQWQPTEFGFWQAFNLREVQVKGIESSIQLKQEKGKIKKTLFLNYTITQSLNKNRIHQFDGSTNKQLIYIPENQSNIHLTLERLNYYLNYNWQFVGARYTTTDNTEWQPDYQISNLSLGRKIKHKRHQLNVEFSVLNLFDVEYQAIQWRPMPNRNYQLSLTYQLF